MGIIAPGTADRPNEEGNNIRHYDSGVDIALETGPSRFRQVDTIYHVDGTIDSYVELHNEVTWEIIGLDSGCRSIVSYVFSAINVTGRC